MSGFLVVVVLLGLVWLFIVLPVRRRQKATTASHEAMQDALVPGDEIITAGGLYATVRTIDDDRLEIEIAPGMIATLDRRAVAAVAEDLDELDEDSLEENNVDETPAEQEEPEPEPNEPGPENDGQPR